MNASPISEAFIMLALYGVISGMSLEDRIRFHQIRVERELAAERPDGKERSGEARPIIRDDFEQFPSVSAAARVMGVKPDWICQAIRRAGTSAGHRWAYIDNIPPDFFSEADGACCAFPFRMGNPVFYFERREQCPEPVHHGKQMAEIL